MKLSFKLRNRDGKEFYVDFFIDFNTVFGEVYSYIEKGYEILEVSINGKRIRM